MRNITQCYNISLIIGNNIYSRHLHEERYITLQHLPHNIYSQHLHEERYGTLQDLPHTGL